MVEQARERNAIRLKEIRRMMPACRVVALGCVVDDILRFKGVERGAQFRGIGIDVEPAIREALVRIPRLLRASDAKYFEATGFLQQLDQVARGERVATEDSDAQRDLT